MFEFLKLVNMLMESGAIPDDTQVDVHKSYEHNFAILLAATGDEADRVSLFSTLDAWCGDHLDTRLGDLPHQKGITK